MMLEDLEVPFVANDVVCSLETIERDIKEFEEVREHRYRDDAGRLGVSVGHERRGQQSGKDGTGYQGVGGGTRTSGDDHRHDTILRKEEEK